MKFERIVDSPTTCKLTFEGGERAILNYSLIIYLGKAATLGNEQISDSRVINAIQRILEPKNLVSNGIYGVDDRLAEVFAEAIEQALPNIKDTSVQEAGGMAALLKRIVTILNSDPETRSITESDIEAIIDNIIIPDSPEDLDGL